MPLFTHTSAPSETWYCYFVDSRGYFLKSDNTWEAFTLANVGSYLFDMAATEAGSPIYEATNTTLGITYASSYAATGYAIDETPLTAANMANAVATVEQAIPATDLSLDTPADVNVVSFSGVAPQAIRDALALPGTDGAESVDDQLAAAIAAAEGAGAGATVYTSVTYAGPVPPDDGLPIVLYKGKAASLPFEITDYTGSVADGDTLTLRIMQLDVYEDQTAATYPALLEATTTATLAAGTLTFTFVLTASDTAALTAGDKGDGSTDHKLIVLPPGDGYPLKDRTCIVRRVPGAVA